MSTVSSPDSLRAAHLSPRTLWHDTEKLSYLRYSNFLDSLRELRFIQNAQSCGGAS